MKITAVKKLFYNTNLYVKIETDEGVFGIGEGTLGTRTSAVAEAVASLARLVVGWDASDIEHIWQSVYRGVFWRGGPVLLCALAALDAALWDIKGKALNAPVYSLLGGRCRNKIRMYNHCYGTTPEELRAAADRVLKNGYTMIRVCPHDNLDGGAFDPASQIKKSVRFMKALRKHVGDETEIIFECHTRFSPARAVELSNALLEFNPVFIEDPIRSDSPENYRHLRAHTNAPLATGEKLGAVWDYKTLVREDLIDYIRADLINCGGISSMRKIAAYGEAHCVEMAPHLLPSGAGMMAALHVDMATPNFLVQEDRYYGAEDPHLETDMRYKDGYVTLGDSPGLGLILDESKCSLVCAAEGDHPYWKRPDGAFQDW